MTPTEKSINTTGVKLLPCPFCGDDKAKIHSPPKLKDRSGHYPSIAYCSNMSCQAQGPAISSLAAPEEGLLNLRLKPRYQQDAEVAAAWNRRKS